MRKKREEEKDGQRGGGGGGGVVVLLDELPDGVQLQVVPRLLLQEQRDLEEMVRKQETRNRKPVARKPETESLTCVPRLRVSPLGSSTTEKLLASDSQMC